MLRLIRRTWHDFRLHLFPYEISGHLLWNVGFPYHFALSRHHLDIPQQRLSAFIGHGADGLLQETENQTVDDLRRIWIISIHRSAQAEVRSVHREGRIEITKLAFTTRLARSGFSPQ